MALLLIASTSSAPQLPPLPEGLPPALMTPCEDCCRQEGVWLPLARANAIDEQRQECKVLPERCQIVLDVAEAQAELDKKLAELRGFDEASKPDLLGKLTWGIGGVIVGILIVGAFSLGAQL